MVSRIIKGAFLPVLLVASVFSHNAAGYQPFLDLAVCLGALLFVHRTLQAGEYFRAAALVAIAVSFSPVVLIAKIFLLMGLAGATAFATALVVLQTQNNWSRHEYEH